MSVKGAKTKETLNYRSLMDLKRVIHEYIHKLPEDIDVVVGIPRSGLLAANIMALHLNLPLTDVEGLLNYRLLLSGERLQIINHRTAIEQSRKILVVDDSCLSGSALRRARGLIQADPLLRDKTAFLAVFGASKDMQDADFVLEECPAPRVFEWNIFHHPILGSSCMDVDGVLCRDPLDEENDDGKNYVEFVRNVRPKVLPTVKIGNLVTSRLEKYREETEGWLRRHKIEYDCLWMLNMDSAEERKKSKPHAMFKAKVYEKTEASLFIESTVWQAREIVRRTAKSVYCTEDCTMYGPLARWTAPSGHGDVPLSLKAFLVIRADELNDLRWQRVRSALGHVDARNGVKELLEGVRRDPLCLLHRPTLGAAKKLLVKRVTER